MERRRLIRTAGALAAAGLAGCVGGQPDPPENTPTDGSSVPPSSFSVTGSRCGTQTNRADIAFDEGRVTVEGTIWGNDACYTGRLESATVDDGTLTVRVTAEPADGRQGCAQCITEIDYHAVVPAPETPAEVVVVHRDERVVTAHP